MNNEIIIPQEVIASKIVLLRNKKVMLSSDLAELYEVSVKRLNEQVKRNIGRFPDRYMFKLTEQEYKILRSQIATLKQGQHAKYPPFAFTEHGILMLSSVLKSKRAEIVNILIVDTFVKLNSILHIHKDLFIEIENLKKSVSIQDKKTELVLQYLKQFIKENETPRKTIGFKQKKE